MKEFWAASRTIYPSIFRVMIGFVLLLDLSSTYMSGKILCNPVFNDFLPESGITSFLAEHYQIFSLAYGIVLVAFILGIGKNLTSFLVFCFHLIVMEMTFPLMTWGDIILKFSLLYFVFADSFKYLSLRKSNKKASFISQLAVWSIILHLFLIYLNNAYFKILDKDWQQGIAVFYSFSQYHGFQDSSWYSILSHKSIANFINYFIIIQQLTFVPLVLWKKSRNWAIILSVLIHIIMMFQFGLWKFELIVILLYGFLLSDEEWGKLIPVRFQKKYFSNFYSN